MAKYISEPLDLKAVLRSCRSLEPTKIHFIRLPSYASWRILRRTDSWTFYQSRDLIIERRFVPANNDIGRAVWAYIWNRPHLAWWDIIRAIWAAIRAFVNCVPSNQSDSRNKQTHWQQLLNVSTFWLDLASSYRFWILEKPHGLWRLLHHII